MPKIKPKRGSATSTDDENSPRVRSLTGSTFDVFTVDELTNEVAFIVENTGDNEGNDTHLLSIEEEDFGFAQEVYIYSEANPGEKRIPLVAGSPIKQVTIIVEDNDRYSGSNYRERYDAFVIDAVRGGSTADLLIGTDLGDAVYGRQGNDTVLGLEGENSLYGWQGNDLMIGGSRPDVLVGGSGDDKLYGGATLGVDYSRSVNTVDFLDGGAGADFLDGGSGDGYLYGGTGGDTLFGGLGDDSLDGESGSDLIDGGAGADVMTGGVGNDTFFVDNAGDRVFENAGGGVDTVITSLSYYLDGQGGEGGGVTPIDQVVENVILDGSSNISGAGNTLDNVIVGNAGRNFISGFDGNDRLIGDNSLFSGGEADFLVGGTGNDTLVGGKGNDTIFGGPGADAFVFESPNDGIDEIRDFQFSEGDKIYVSLQNFGGISNDYSQFAYDSTTRILSFQNKAFVRFQEGVNFIPSLDIVLTNDLPSSLANIPSTPTPRLSGTRRSDRIVGRSQTDQIFGKEGNDVIAGLEGTDALFGEGGDDLLEGGTDADTLSGGTDQDRLFGEFGDDLLTGEDGNDFLSGGRDLDTLVGGKGNDTLYGGEDDDVLTGSAGSDWFTFYRPANINVALDRDASGNVSKVRIQVAYYLNEDRDVLYSSLQDQEFHVGEAASTSSHRIIYDAATGALYFDVNGTGLSSTLPRQVPIATLPKGLPLTANQIQVQANAGDSPVVSHKPYSDGVDRITDFNISNDVIGIYVGAKIVSAFSFAGLTPNAVLKKTQFKVGTAATTRAHRFIYDDRTGSLYFDRDGTGSLAPVQIAKLDKRPSLSYQNIRTFDDAGANQFTQSSMMSAPLSANESWI